MKEFSAIQLSRSRGFFFLNGHGVPRPKVSGRVKEKTEQICHAGTNLRPRDLLSWMVLYLLFYLSAAGWIWQDSVAKKDKEARRLYEEEKIDEALSKWRDAQIESPEKKELHYNIGNALHKQKEYQDALGEYEKSADAKDDELRAKTYYNIGNTHYRMGRLPEAIEDYEKCLEITPDDEDAKHNIEFIKKKMEEQKKQKQEKSNSDKEEKPEKEKSQEEKQQSQDSGEQRSQGKEQEREQKDQEKEKPAPEAQGQDKEMSEEDAIRLLDALKDDEKDLQKDLRSAPAEGRYRIEKDW